MRRRRRGARLRRLQRVKFREPAFAPRIVCGATMGRYSAWRVFMEGLKGQAGWEPVWRSPALKPKYDIIVVGGGGHGLATAYYLAKAHRVSNVAVLEAGWIGGGNSGRNTTIVRSNYY